VGKGERLWIQKASEASACDETRVMDGPRCDCGLLIERLVTSGEYLRRMGAEDQDDSSRD